MDCIVHGVAKSQTQLSGFHYHTFTRCTTMRSPMSLAGLEASRSGGASWKEVCLERSRADALLPWLL